MPFYFRKSVNAGPFRFNISQHGFGASVGVKGLRIGTGPRGHYVHAGSNGFYYRATIGHASSAGMKGPAPLSQTQHWLPDDSDMIPITSGNLLAMQDTVVANILQEINTKHRQPRLSLILGLVSTLAAIAIVSNFGVFSVLPSLLLAIAGAIFGSWLDSYKRAVVLFYDDEEVIAPIFREISLAFDGLAGCAGKWHIRAAKPVYDLTTWKRQAGASRLVERKVATLAYQLPPIIKSNVIPPVVQAGNRRIYFFPDMALVEGGGTFGAVSYEALSLRSEPSNFIEEGSVPQDTEILYYTWQHPNKSGGPDRRFKYNRQLPVCRYDLLHLTSGSGMNELFEFSRQGLANVFINAIKNSPRQINPEVTALPSPPTPENSDTAERDERWLPRWAAAALWLIGLLSTAFILFGLARMAPSAPSPIAEPAETPAPKAMFVAAAGLNCRSTPSVTSEVVKAFRSGEGILVQSQQGKWSEIKLETGACWSVSSGLSVAKPVVKKPVRRKKVRKKVISPPESEPETSLPEIY